MSHPHELLKRVLEIQHKILEFLEEHPMAVDDTALEAAITKLSTDADALISEKTSADQAAQAKFDAATAAVNAVDQKIVAAS